jgi:hypothetical protein
MSSSYTIKLSGLPNTPFGYAIKDIVEFWPLQLKNTEEDAILTGMVQQVWLALGQRVLWEKEKIEFSVDLYFKDLSVSDTLKESIKWAMCTKFCLAYVESWKSFSLSELSLWEAIFELKELRQRLAPIKQKDCMHFDCWIKTQKEWKLQEFYDALQGKGQGALCDRWRTLKNDVNHERNPFKLEQPEIFRRLLISLVLEARKLISTSEFCNIWLPYQAEYANHLKILRYGIEYEGEKNVKKQTLRIEGTKIVGLGHSSRGSIPLEPRKPFDSGRGRKPRKVSVLSFSPRDPTLFQKHHIVYLPRIDFGGGEKLGTLTKEI